MESENTVNVVVQTEQTSLSNKKMKSCKTCGAQMVKSAKVCPSCGAKNKKPLFKNPALIVLLVIALVCGGFLGQKMLMNKKSTITITLNDGTVISDSIKSIIFKGDSDVNFVSSCLGAKITICGKITSIKGRTEYTTPKHTFQSVLSLEKGWIIVEGGTDTSKYNVGDYIEVKGEISNFFGRCIFINDPNSITIL
ncbi:MAG: hypothetical protein IJK89_10995 [Clostridia bacterium]|nr:hypothetical protein [Clostridia bacterium]